MLARIQQTMILHCLCTHKHEIGPPEIFQSEKHISMKNENKILSIEKSGMKKVQVRANAQF